MFEKSLTDITFLKGEKSRAAEMYREGARDGDYFAAFSYAYCLMTGQGVEKNLSEAKSFFKYSCESDKGESYYNIAMIYFEGGDGVARDYYKARLNFEASAARGCLEAMLYLGVAHTMGCMFTPEIERITMIPRHLPEYRKETLYLEGDIEDFERDEDERYKAIQQSGQSAFYYFRCAAEHRGANEDPFLQELVAKSKFLYARCFVDGLGTDFDREKAESLMLIAARRGSDEAQQYLLENGVLDRLLGEAKGTKNNTLKGN